MNKTVAVIVSVTVLFVAVVPCFFTPDVKAANNNSEYLVQREELPIVTLDSVATNGAVVGSTLNGNPARIGASYDYTYAFGYTDNNTVYMFAVTPNSSTRVMYYNTDGSVGSKSLSSYLHIDNDNQYYYGGWNFGGTIAFPNSGNSMNAHADARTFLFYSGQYYLSHKLPKSLGDAIYFNSGSHRYFSSADVFTFCVRANSTGSVVSQWLVSKTPNAVVQRDDGYTYTLSSVNGDWYYYNFGNANNLIVPFKNFYTADDGFVWIENLIDDYENDSFRIVTQPVSFQGYIGDTAYFRIRTNKSTGVTYQWQFYSTTGQRWTNSPADGNTTSVLSIPVTENRAGYRYRCIVTYNSVSLTSETAVLHVISGERPPDDGNEDDGSITPGTIGSTLSFVLPAGYAAKIVPDDSNFTINLNYQFRALSVIGDGWPLDSTFYAMTNQDIISGTNLNTNFSGYTRIPWEKNGQTNLLNQTRFAKAMLPVWNDNGDYYVIVNPLYNGYSKEEQYNLDMTVNLSYARESQVFLYPLTDTIYTSNGSVVSVAGEPYRVTSNGNYINQNGSAYLETLPYGGNNSPSDPQESTLSDLVSNIGTFFTGTWRHIKEMTTAAGQLPSMVVEMFSWLPAQFKSVIFSAFSIVIAIAIVKVML